MILIIVANSAGLVNQAALASRLRLHGEEVVVLCDGWRETLTPAYASLLRATDCDLVYLSDLVADTAVMNDTWCLPFQSEAGAGRVEVDAARSLTEEAPRVIAEPRTMSSFLSDDTLRRFRSLRHVFGRQSIAVNEFCKLRKPAFAILGDDGIAVNPRITSILKRNSIPLLCVPYGYGGVEDLENELTIKQTDGRYITTAEEGGAEVAEHYPHWVKSGTHAGALLLPPEVILASESIGVTIRHPWRTYGSEADLLCVSGQQYARHLVLEGVSDDRIIVTGSLSGLQIHEILQTDSNARKAFRQPAKIGRGQTRVLVCWPPSYHATHGNRTDFPSNYAALTQATLYPLLDRPDVDLTVALHPSTLPEDRAVFTDLKIPLSTSYIMDLIPKHDIFLAASSSTVRWAIACGKPVLNYDFYKFCSTVFRNLPGVIHVETHQAYIATMQKLLADETFFATTAGAQISVADDWGLVDDRFLEELLAVSRRETSV